MQTKNNDAIRIPVSYHSEWQDGFGARGWKLDAAIDDPQVIASTAETGRNIPTSVFVHDIVDHHLCGLALSGHRNEAIALTLLELRTGSSPIPDFTQMVEEDILRGNVNGESMRTFLPDSLMEQVPQKIRGDNKLSIGYLTGLLGEAELKQVLINNFIQLGQSGLNSAMNEWNKSGLDFSQRKNIGLCIQNILEQIDPNLVQQKPETLHGELCLSNRDCKLILDSGEIYVAQNPTN